MSKDIDIKFIDVSAWQSQDYLNSGGSRAKSLLVNGDDQYFFKRSEFKPGTETQPEKYYRYEFLSEVIAYQLGKKLGLDILRYDIANYDGIIGCLSPQMVPDSSEELLELGRFMTAHDNNFLPKHNHNRKLYTFQLLESTLKEFELEEYWFTIFETMIFDAIIGNTDRHQENWALLGKSTSFTEAIDMPVEQLVEELRKEKLWIEHIGMAASKIFGSLAEKNMIERALLNQYIKKGLAPIYDSGSSLARELENDKVHSMLVNENQLLKYINKGTSELHWNGIKLSHFDLISKILSSNYREKLIDASKFVYTWDNDWITAIIDTINKTIPISFATYHIPTERKELITKLVNTRAKKIKELLERV